MKRTFKVGQRVFVYRYTSRISPATQEWTEGKVSVPSARMHGYSYHQSYEPTEEGGKYVGVVFSAGGSGSEWPHYVRNARNLIRSEDEYQEIIEQNARTRDAWSRSKVLAEASTHQKYGVLAEDIIRMVKSGAPHEDLVKLLKERTRLR